MDAFKKLVNQGKDIVRDARKRDVNALKEDAQQVQDEVNAVNEALDKETPQQQTATASGAAGAANAAADRASQAAGGAHATADEQLGNVLDNVAKRAKDSGQSV